MYTKDELQKAVDNSSSINGVIQFLSLNKSSATYKSIKSKMDAWGIEPNFKVKKNKKYTHDDIFCEDSTYDRKDLRKKIINENLLEYKCCTCGISEWNNQPLSLQIDHINGKNRDNRLENLRFLCPNCHAQTATWGNNNSRSFSL